MKKIILNNRAIYIGAGLARHLRELINFERYSKILVVFDPKLRISENIADSASYLPLSLNEAQKNIESVQKIWLKLKAINADRKSLLVNIGGGTLLDVASFAASAYMRGIDFVNIPTTLLAQADAGIGGKNGFNFAGIKNLIGTFRDPVAVIIDVNFLKTLPERHFNSGMAEMLKHGLIYDEKYFKRVKSLSYNRFSDEKFSDEKMQKLIEKSCEIKAKIAGSDPFDQNARKVLNFGHTLGHALEALSLESKVPYLHGEAVLLGMNIECILSHLKGYIDETDVENIRNGIGKFMLRIPWGGKDFGIDAIYSKIMHDKKNDSGKVNWTLLGAVGKAVVDQQVDKKLLKEAMSYAAKF